MAQVHDHNKPKKIMAQDRTREDFMRKSFYVVMAAFLVGLMLLGGCAPRVGGSDYDSSTVRTAQNVNYGTVADVRVVRINDDSGTNEAIGTVGGGVVGGVLGSMVGGGTGRTLATVGGAVLGAGAGYAGGKALSTQDGYEITVDLDNGGSTVITQGADIEFSRGQRVKVISGGGAPARVVPY